MFACMLSTADNRKQGPPNVFIWGPHKLSHNSSRAGHLT